MANKLINFCAVTRFVGAACIVVLVYHITCTIDVVNKQADNISHAILHGHKILEIGKSKCQIWQTMCVTAAEYR